MRASTLSAPVLGLLLAVTPAQADLEFPELRADVGQVRSGPALAHTFPFVNRGPEAVEFIEVRASCGCLTPRLDRRTYPPGEGGQLRLEVNTLSQAPGPHTWRVDLRYRCGETLHDAALLLCGTLFTEVSVTPAAINLYVDRGLSQEIIVTDLRPGGLTVTGAAATSQGLRARSGARFRDAAGHWACRVALEVADDYPEGRHEETFSVYTDDPAYRELRVPVTVVKHVRQRLSAAPAEVSLRAAPGQPIPSRVVLVRDRDSQPVVVTAVQADNPAVVCRWAAGPDTMATIKLQVDRSQMRGDTLQTTVHVHVSRPTPEVLDIPVTCSK
jgi:hypothetical protein